MTRSFSFVSILRKHGENAGASSRIATQTGLLRWHLSLQVAMDALNTHGSIRFDDLINLLLECWQKVVCHALLPIFIAGDHHMPGRRQGLTKPSPPCIAAASRSLKVKTDPVL